MTRGHYISGSTGPFQSLLRAIFMIAAAIVGFFVFAGAAAFALFIALGLLILGGIAFAVFWFRAKILKKPLMPKMKMQGFSGFDMPGAEQSTKAGKANKADNDGPIIDAHQTPDGWSVDTD